MEPSIPSPPSENLFDAPEFDQYLENLLPALIEESDRGAVLLGASQIDILLGDFFNALAPESTSGKRRKDIFNLTGPFGSLSSKLDVAYTCRLLPGYLVEAIHRFRKLRNDVAHKPSAFSLADHEQEVRSIFELIGEGVSLSVASIAKQLMVRNAIASVMNLDDPSNPGQKLFADLEAVVAYLGKNTHHLQKLEPRRLRWELGVGLGLVCALIAFHRRKLLDFLGPEQSMTQVIARAGTGVHSDA